MQEEIGSIEVTTLADRARLAVEGVWTLKTAAALHDRIAAITASIDQGTRLAVIDLSRLDRLDVSGAWLIHSLRTRLESSGRSVTMDGCQEADRILLDEVAKSDQPPAPAQTPRPLVDVAVGGVGDAVIHQGLNAVHMVDMLGRFVTAVGLAVANPLRFRLVSTIHHLEQMGLRAVPIIALISFLIGAIIAQQGAFQLRRFGAELFAVDLSAILVLREIGVLLAAIMVAGRSGSAITAEIGSMKMREEVDALRVLALDPIAVLVVPRILALMIALPLLTVLADMAALLGAGLTSWLYSGIGPDLFMQRLSAAADFRMFAIGLMKAPFFALLIGIIAAQEGFAVQGSAESLGQRVTASVVKAIFVVIVLDGVFAIFFAAIGW